jgi:HEPN domain-containing protein
VNGVSFQKIAEIRLRESRALLAAGFPEGAYYLAVYAVECALKACIAKRTREREFPDKGSAMESYAHNLKELVRVALLNFELDEASKASPRMNAYWRIVRGWSEESRYLRKTVAEAQEHLQAIDDREGRILFWVQKRR